VTTLGAAKVARRYALALMNTAARFGRVETVRADLEALVASRRQSTVLQRVVESPLVSLPEKRRLIQEALADADEITRRFADLLLRRKRFDLLPAIYEEYLRCSDEAMGVARVYVTTAAPLSNEEAARIQEAMQRRMGRQVRLHVQVEAALLGGISIRVGDTVWDGSVRGALEVMHERMLRESSLAR